MLTDPFLYLCLLWTAWVLQASICAWHVWRLSRRVRKAVGKRNAYTPPATVIIPVKGIDLDLPESIRAFCKQDYPDYRLAFVVESDADPAYPVLKRELARFQRPQSRILFSGRAGGDVGQKVHNQLCVLDELEPADDDGDVWVFADSDFIANRHWLADMIAPLSSARTGMTTGYRWMVPEPQAGGLWSHLASVVNSSVACLYRWQRFETAWGGAMAIRVETARRGKLRQWLSKSLTDDLQFTRMCHSLGLRVRFVPQCLVVTPVALDFPALWEFARRQYLLARVYLPLLYLVSIGITGLYFIGNVSAWVSLVAAISFGWSVKWIAAPAAAIVSVFAANQVRTWQRRRLIRGAFGKSVLRKLRVTLRYDRWATSLWMLLHLILIVGAGIGRRFRWRTIEYYLAAPQDVRRVGD